MFARDLNIRLSVVYLEQWLDASRINYHDDIERTLSTAVEYVTGEIYQIGKCFCRFKNLLNFYKRKCYELLKLSGQSLQNSASDE